MRAFSLCLLITHLGKAFAAIDRLVVFWNEWHFRFRPAFCANGAIAHFFAMCVLFRRSTITAPDRIIQESFFRKKFLFSGGKYKFLSAVAAHKRFVLVHFIPSLCFFNGRTARLTWSLPPHPPAGGFAPKALASPLLPLSGFLHLTDVQPKIVFLQSKHLAGLTSKLPHDHRPFGGLRGSFCPQLASIFNHRPEFVQPLL